MAIDGGSAENDDAIYAVAMATITAVITVTTIITTTTGSHQSRGEASRKQDTNFGAGKTEAEGRGKE